ncbi:MAG: DUF1963 domain-containing protein [Micrococcales bacterium]|nr:DUF1963 domain-containing protein [Micrococcales bacterium]
MGWLNGLFGTRTAAPTDGGEVDDLPGLLVDPADETAVTAALDALVDETMTDYLRLTLAPGELRPWSSKVGGRPYVQGGGYYPRGKGAFAGEPLHLLAQLNFAELPALPGLPRTGLLQFFVAADERRRHVYGADPADPTAPDGFRVVYHPRVIEDESLLARVVPDPQAEPFLPVAGGCGLTGQIASQPMSSSDHRFEERLTALVRTALGTDEVPDWVRSAAAQRFGNPSGHQVGGYPGLSSAPDPRHQFPRHTTLLFQLASDSAADVEIVWGDLGVGAFFVAPDRLAACDFSDVLYTWG